MTQTAKCNELHSDAEIHPVTGENRRGVDWMGRPRELEKFVFTPEQRKAKFRRDVKEAITEIETRETSEDRIKKELADLRETVSQGFKAVNEAIESQKTERALVRLTEWAESHPHFHMVKDTMMLLLKMDERGMGDLLINVKSDVALEPAYQSACWANDTIREKLLAERDKPDDPTA